MNTPSPEQPYLSATDSPMPNPSDAKSSQPGSPNKVRTDPVSGDLLEPYRGYVWAIALSPCPTVYPICANHEIAASSTTDSFTWFQLV